jgi:putative transport protein
MIDLLADNPLLLLFVVAAVGYAVGRVRVAGFGFGVAGVLFTGLAFGALSPRLTLPDLVYQFGLVLFVYTVGLASGPGFVASLRRRGLRDNAVVLGLLVLAALVTKLAQAGLGFSGPMAAGLFAGAFTNTPALAGVLEVLKAGGGPDQARALAEPVIAYSVCYPIGVVGMLVAVYVTQRVWKVDHRAEAERLRMPGMVQERFEVATARVTRAAATEFALHALLEGHHWRVLATRVRHEGHVRLVTPGEHLALGDLVTLVGAPADVAAAVAALGEPSAEPLDLDRRDVDLRRVSVSRRELAGKRVAELNLPARFGALVTRVRRGDVDLLVDDDTVLELGDRVRVLAPRARLDEVTRFLGDSSRELSEVDVLSLGLGVALGLFVGLVPLPLPGGGTFKLGLAGGPLVVGLLLGVLGRSGPVLWQMPFGANLTLRQIGLVLFLAGVGTRSGWVFANNFGAANGLALFGVGAALTLGTALLLLWVGYRLLRIPMGVLTGMLAGLQTQPAVLAYAVEQSDNELPNVGYATVYPVALIAKIVLAQLVLGGGR